MSSGSERERALFVKQNHQSVFVCVRVHIHLYFIIKVVSFEKSSSKNAFWQNTFDDTTFFFLTYFALTTTNTRFAKRNMSRVKIVKEAGAKPTDFENTVAKVLRLFRCRRARRTVGRQRSRRGDFVSEGNPTRALFLYAKNGAHACKRALKKRRGREAALKKRARVGRI